jgi:hypothetical protein
VDALVRDAYRAHYALRGERLDPRVAEAAELLATVTGQDIEETADGRFRIVEGTAPDRVISTVDPQARHGHKTAAHGFDGYKGHLAADPDSEIVTAAEVSAATSGDAVVAPTLLGDLAPGEGEPTAWRARSWCPRPPGPSPAGPARRAGPRPRGGVGRRRRRWPTR